MELVNFCQLALELLHFNLIHFDLVLPLGVGLRELYLEGLLHLGHLRMVGRGLSLHLGLQFGHLRLKVLDLRLVLSLHVGNAGLGGLERLNLLDQGSLLLGELLVDLRDLSLVLAFHRLELDHELVDLLSLLEDEFLRVCL